MAPRVLVIGSGLAGLTTAYLLRKEGCEVYIVERSEQLGFHSSSVVVPASGKGSGSTDWVVDVPMRSFQGGYYPLLIALYRHLGLALIPSDFTFSFSHLCPSPSSPRVTLQSSLPALSTYFIHSGSSGVSPPSFPSSAYRSILSLARAVLRWISFAICYILLLLLAFISWHSLLPLPSTLGSLLGFTGYLPFGLDGLVHEFINDILLPLFSAVGTMTTADVLDAPLKTILGYVHSTVGTSHYALRDCSARGVARLLVEPVKRQGGDHVRLGTEITSIKWSKDAFEVIVKGGEEIHVDRVVLATQASSALALLDLVDGVQSKSGVRRITQVKKALQKVQYRHTIVVTHRDQSVLPDTDDIRDINLVLPRPPPMEQSEDSDGETTPPLSPPITQSPASVSGLSTPIDGSMLVMPYFRPTSEEIYTMGTHVLWPPKGFEGSEPVLQTTNPVLPIAADIVLGLAKLERALPLRHPESVIAALSSPEELDEAGPSSRVHFVGSYAYPGIPLLEGCVGSAIRAVEEIMKGQELSMRHPNQTIGGVDWSAGQGGFMGRLWRWKRRRRI